MRSTMSRGWKPERREDGRSPEELRVEARAEEEGRSPEELRVEARAEEEARAERMREWEDGAVERWRR